MEISFFSTALRGFKRGRQPELEQVGRAFHRTGPPTSVMGGSGMLSAGSSKKQRESLPQARFSCHLLQEDFPETPSLV